MTIINLERRIRKFEAARHRSDPALKATPDAELEQTLREASDDPADHALADWFQAGDGSAPLPTIALGAMQRSL